MDVSAFIGPLLVEICFALILYGVFCAQVYYWWSAYKDPLHVRIIIWSLLVLETVHVGFCIHVLYWYFILNFSNENGLNEIAWSFGVTVYLEASVLISATVQSFYMLRIWRLRKQILVVGFMAALLIARVGLAFRTTSFAYEFSTWAGLLEASYTHAPINAGWALNVAVDAGITFVLATYLYQDRSAATKRGTKTLINKLAHYAISTGALTLMASTAIFITFNARSHSLVFGGLLEVLTKCKYAVILLFCYSCYSIPKVYANSMLAMLNARRSVMEKASSTNNMTVELSDLAQGVSSYNNARSAVIQVTKETTTMTDAWDVETRSPAVSAHSVRLATSEELYDTKKSPV
ncbi:hypothetical protein BDY19DRAFT_991436 [Irpex rosettiformis]|uniref:Uncharacterized protein n=1 Tax=Irpex rosettiformis TaxID=378272 RepID=A0ACB8UBR4_9APHY|nr:hypothetical protein BDY19DRAFT_991436 [Irpex rosettiformis]